jgi:4-amino-4-deoxy-L-arabinose transferase-like glycosyltransferase
MPGVALSSGVISTDAPLLCFLSLTLLAYVGMQQGGPRAQPLAAGFGAALGLAMLSKYAAVYALIGLALHLALSKEARKAWTWRTVALAVAAFATIVGPNLIWNANHGFATIGHTAANANLGGELFNPGELLSFIGGQFGVFGPLPFAVLVGGAGLLAARRRLLPPDLLLACFAAPPLIVVAVQAFISRANDNWAAAAYVAGSVLAAALLMRAWTAVAERKRLRLALALLMGFGLVLQVAVSMLLLVVAADPTIADRLGRSNDIKRVRGWARMTEEVVRRTRLEQLNGGLSAVAVDDRFLFNSLSYYGRDFFGGPDAPPLRVWLRHGHAGNQAEATAPLTPVLGRRVLAVSIEGIQAPRIAADFRTARTVEIVSLLLSPKCRFKTGEKPEKFDHRCRRRATLMLGEDFRPLVDRD